MSRLNCKERKGIKKRLFKRDGHKCFYCESTENLTIDHIIPYCRGGSNRLSNLVTACFTCNNSRGKRDAFEFLREVLA